MLDSSNCTTAPPQAASDAGVAGAGVLLSFIVTAGLALLLSAWIITLEIRRSSASTIARKLLNSFSDQQILTGILIQSVGLAKMDTMVPYHFFIIWMLSSISTATHSAALLALLNDFKRDWVLRWLRQALMLVNLVLSCVSGIFILQQVTKKVAPTLPIACVWHEPATEPRDDVPISIVGTVAVMVGQILVFAMAVFYLHTGTVKWLQSARAASFVILTAIAVGAAVRCFQVSQAFGSPEVPLSDAGEKDWSFGQLLPLFLLLLPLINSIEIFRGEVKVPSPMEDDQKPLFETEDGFDRNPFWNSQIPLKSR
ncbi:hypothetical protein K402DRAFT_339079 [Aulographum hederae CBS 113979]|uniref:Uncharacterized protein n=1 Tax=Aulographum hederae CBS 113979 TaxID=1176131 RepID=A0A6G1GQH9_9PEZI|nr:hypothetical protein K402DRAFT_339079 [Aulographum hederae CBS 113979]